MNGETIGIEVDPTKRVAVIHELTGKKFRLVVEIRPDLAATATRTTSSSTGSDLDAQHWFDYYVISDSGKANGRYMHITAEQLRRFDEERVRTRSDFPDIVLKLRRRVYLNWVNIHTDRLWNITNDRRNQTVETLLAAIYREFLLINYLPYFRNEGTFAFNLAQLETLPSASASTPTWSPEHKKIRLSESVSTHHEMHSSVFAMLGHVSAMQALTANYRALDKDHEDRVDHLYAIPLQDILKYDGKKSMTAYFERIVRSLYPDIKREDSIKVSIKHHLLEVLFAGIQKKWKNKHGVLSHEDSLHCPYQLARRRSAGSEDLAMIVSIVLCGKSSIKNKFEIDVPGGKRELGESSLECAIRETWEEVGIDLSGCSLFEDVSDCLSSPWVICQHRELNDYSCYVALHHDLWNELHRNDSTSMSVTRHRAEKDEEMDALASNMISRLKISHDDTVK